MPVEICTLTLAAMNPEGPRHPGQGHLGSIFTFTYLCLSRAMDGAKGHKLSVQRSKGTCHSATIWRVWHFIVGVWVYLPTGWYFSLSGWSAGLRMAILCLGCQIHKRKEVGVGWGKNRSSLIYFSLLSRRIESDLIGKVWCILLPLAQG